MSDVLTSKYRCRYVYSARFGSPRHSYELIGAVGGIHFHVTDYGDEHAAKFGERYSGGLEIHLRQPAEYQRHDPPSQDECWLLKCPCWHDGSSLYASETIIPFWLCDPGDHERMFGWLRREAERRFRGEDEA